MPLPRVSHHHRDPVVTLSRRALIRRSMALGGAGLAGIVSVHGASAGPAKITQAQAKYRDAPNGPASCGKCNQFQPPSTCKLVQGAISPTGWCSLFTPK
jgi:hypothetical protein